VNAGARAGVFVMSDAQIQHFYDEATGTLSYVVADPATGHAAIVDPVVGYSLVSGRLETAPSDVVIEYIHKEKLGLEWILETHAHADHLTGAQYIKSKLGGSVAIGEGIRIVQAHFGPVFNLHGDFQPDGRQFDRLFADGERFAIGKLECEVIATPGHTNDSISYRIGSAVFVGDSMFMPDFGTARCDFPGGDAALLYDSIQRLLSLPGDTRLYMCHDYKPDGRELRWQCTVEEQRNKNIHVNSEVSKDEFTAMRRERDSTLSLPTLIVPSIQVNIRAGHLPDAENNGIAYLKTPIDTL
jgi:glyoxylase-like metal-dependent hydrolase (beta-lactamase superfamily II)